MPPEMPANNPHITLIVLYRSKNPLNTPPII